MSERKLSLPCQGANLMRRMFRRQIRKTLAQAVPPILQEANFNFDKGEYGRAGELFEQLAQTADTRGGPRASIFYLQAGRARLFAGQTNLGIPSLKRGLQLFAQRGQFHKLHRFSQRVIYDLRSRGLTAEAAEIEAWLKNMAPSLPAVNLQPTAEKRPTLPTHC